MGIENDAISISVQILNCSSVSPRFRANDSKISEGKSRGRVRITVTTIRERHVPPAFFFPLPLSAVQVGQSTGNLCSSRRAMTCPRRHSRQKVCPQVSMRANESAGILSMHILHSNSFPAEVESSLRRSERARASFSKSRSTRIPCKTFSTSSGAEGDVGHTGRGRGSGRVGALRCVGKGLIATSVLMRNCLLMCPRFRAEDCEASEENSQDKPPQRPYLRMTRTTSRTTSFPLAFGCITSGAEYNKLILVKERGGGSTRIGVYD